MEYYKSRKVGVYVDVSNIAMNGGYGMQYDVMREFAGRNNGICVRLNAYLPYDEEKARADAEYKKKTNNFHSILRDFGYKVIVKTVKWYVDDENHKYGKANSDLDMAVDALLQSEKLDYVVMLTGDGDFIQVVRALQNKGCRVDVIGFKNVSGALKKEADSYVSGYLIPELLPIEESYPNADIKWGEPNSRVRGICFSFHHDKGYGFMRYIDSVEGGLWITDSRKEESPYQTAFVHKSQFAELLDVTSLPNRDIIFEFDLTKVDKGIQGTNLSLVHSEKYL